MLPILLSHIKTQHYIEKTERPPKKGLKLFVYCCKRM